VKPLSYPLKRLLSAVEANPGFSRAELAKLLYQEMNPYYSTPKVSRMVKILERRGLVEFDTIHDRGRAGVPGVYMVGKARPSKPGYLGVFGWKEVK
jgi:hypothetical protein